MRTTDVRLSTVAAQLVGPGPGSGPARLLEVVEVGPDGFPAWGDIGHRGAGRHGDPEQVREWIREVQHRKARRRARRLASRVR